MAFGIPLHHNNEFGFTIKVLSFGFWFNKKKGHNEKESKANQNVKENINETNSRFIFVIGFHLFL